VELDVLVDGMLAVVRETLQPKRVSLWLRRPATESVQALEE
jgi:hypothetical protein